MKPFNSLHIVLLNPFHSGSHKKWAEGLIKHSKHRIQLFSLPGRNWKWRMHGAAEYFADILNDLKNVPDIVLTTDMLDLSTLISLSRKRYSNTRFYQYFHENQITYPWSPEDQDIKLKRDYHYAYINYLSALSADRVFFNSEFHLEAFVTGAKEMLGHFPDAVNSKNIDRIKDKSSVLSLGMDLSKLLEIDRKQILPKNHVPHILWNHRWEYDKQPEVFFKNLFKLKKEGIPFKLIVLGESYSKSPSIFEKVKHELSAETIHFGYVLSESKYIELMELSDILPVTNIQDFFGGSIVEAISAGVLPLLPFRLAYPSHLPEVLHRRFYYQKEEELFDRLKSMIENFNTYSSYRKDLRNAVSRYDWQQLIQSYDEAFL